AAKPALAHANAGPVTLCRSARSDRQGQSTQRPRQTVMPLQVTTIMLGVEDLARSKKFYAEGLGCAIGQDYPAFVSFALGSCSSSLAPYERGAGAPGPGVAPPGAG